uniref:Uncharacterized protein n=1 Tax=Globisporangium ultimum (strain ATCC 200006 / CBS 805.95 / DAOM BR144) TaxID=431595 RepID=K3WEZ7_GLOUD
MLLQTHSRANHKTSVRFNFIAAIPTVALTRSSIAVLFEPRPCRKNLLEESLRLKFIPPRPHHTVHYRSHLQSARFLSAHTKKTRSFATHY